MNKQINYINPSKKQKLEKTKEYRKINNIRTILLKHIDNEFQEYEKSKVKINSKTANDYCDKYLKNIIITLRTKNIVSASIKKVSFLKDKEEKKEKSSIDIIKKNLVFQCNHHYKIFKERRKLVLSKISYANLLSKIKDNKSENSTPSSNCSCSTDDKSVLILNLFNKKENSKVYFDYLHTLFFSLHKNIHKGKIVSEITLNHNYENDNDSEEFFHCHHEKNNGKYYNSSNKRFSKAINNNLESVNYLSYAFLPKRKNV